MTHQKSNLPTEKMLYTLAWVKDEFASKKNIPILLLNADMMVLVFIIPKFFFLTFNFCYWCKNLHKNKPIIQNYFLNFPKGSIQIFTFQKLFCNTSILLYYLSSLLLLGHMNGSKIGVFWICSQVIS